MFFNICLANLENKNSVEDKARLLRLGLCGLGHACVITDFVIDEAVNILFECFSDEFVAQIEKQHPRTRLVLVATEWLTGATFNDFPGDSASTYSWKEMWQRRFSNFVRLSKRADAIWCLSPHQQADYASISGKPTHYVRHGYVEGFAQARQIPDARKTIDLVFSGTLSKRRLEILDSFRTRGFHVHAFEPKTPTFLRLEMYAQARVVLGLKVSDDWRFPSVSRTHFCLSNRVLLINEWHSDASDLDSFASIAPRDGFIDFVAERLAQGRHFEEACVRAEQFEREAPLVPDLRRVVAESFP